MSATRDGPNLFYHVFKITLGAACVILGVEYAWAYCTYSASSFGILYVADTLTWFLAGGILLTEGLFAYVRAIRRVETVREEANRDQYLGGNLDLHGTRGEGVNKLGAESLYAPSGPHPRPEVPVLQEGEEGQQDGGGPEKDR